LNSCIGALGTCTMGPLPKAPWACKMHYSCTLHSLQCSGSTS